MLLLLLMPFSGQARAQSQSPGLEFSYSLIDVEIPVESVIQQLYENLLPEVTSSGTSLFAIFTPVTKPGDAPFAGLATNQLVLMLAFTGDAAAQLPELESKLLALAGVKTVASKLYQPVYLPDGPRIVTGAGFYVHRDEHYALADLDEAVRLSREAWRTWEPAFGVKIAGLFREMPDLDGIVRLNRIAWYPSYEVWLDTRNFEKDPESQQRFAERRQYLIPGSGIAVATDRALP